MWGLKQQTKKEKNMVLAPKLSEIYGIMIVNYKQ